MSSDNSLVIFKAITNFVNDLAGVFSEKQHSLKLYSHLLEKTTLTHDKAISKHISGFKKFCIANRDSITEKNYSELAETLISYSDKVFIDMENIFSMSDKETEEVIWKHLLFISALVDPTTKVKEILKKEHTKENDFLSNILSKVEEQVDDKDNPMEAITSLMQSGVFTNIVSDLNNGIKNGDIDLTKMMGSVQNMMGELGENGGNGGLPVDMNSMMSNMINVMGGMGAMGPVGENGTPPDINKIMNMLKKKEED